MFVRLWLEVVFLGKLSLCTVFEIEIYPLLWFNALTSVLFIIINLTKSEKNQEIGVIRVEIGQNTVSVLKL